MNAFKDHFSTHAAGYAEHRPRYPAALVDYLASVSPATGLAVDCGCGSGQLSALLARRYARVIATDASAQQIENAEPHERVEYRLARAEHSGLSDGVADLVTAAQAVHWFDLEAFYREVRRLTKPGGVLALITYGLMDLGESGPHAVLQDFYANVLRPYWPPERRMVEEGYRTLPFPFEALQPVPAFRIDVEWSLSELVGYVNTWSAVRAAEKALGREPIARFRAQLAAGWGEPARKLAMSWPLSLRVGRV